MLSKLATVAIAFILLSTVAIGTVSASPNEQAGVKSASLDFHIAVITDATNKGVFTDVLHDVQADYFIENLIAPHTGETPEQIRERLRTPIPSSLLFHIAVINDATDKGVFADALHDALADYFIENLIAPHTGETPEQIRNRLSAQPGPTNTPSSTPTTATATPSATPTTPTATPVQLAPEPGQSPPLAPELRHIIEKRYMLLLINREREKAGRAPVALGNNIAAQLHAEASFDNCFSSHWGIDGLKPHMRYSLAGGYQSNSENGYGSDYCADISDGFRSKESIDQEIEKAVESLMGSPGHRRNILDKWHKKVNIGLAWDRYNINVVQHFEGDYVEYSKLPSIENGVLSVSGRTKNGARFDEDGELSIQIYYDPPTHSLTRGQVSRTYCYDKGLLIAALRWPLQPGWYWPDDEFTTTYRPCPDPYDVPADAPGPRSSAEAREFWQAAYDASQARQGTSIVVPWITASQWTARGESFSVKVDLNGLLAKRGDGVYTIIAWDTSIGGESAVISEYSIFHGTIPPDTYSRERLSVQDTSVPTSTPATAFTPLPILAGWDRYENGAYGFSIDTPPGWTLNNEDTEERDWAYLRAPDRMASVTIKGYDLSDSYSLLALAEWRQDWLRDQAREKSWNVFDITSFAKKQKGEKAFYELVYRHQSSTRYCVESKTERIYISYWYPDKPNGYRVGTSVCEHSLDRYPSDTTNAIHNSFTEWMPYWNATRAFGLNVAPGWTLDETTETNDEATFWATDKAGIFQIHAYEVSPSVTLEDFVNWRMEILNSLGDSWDVYEPKGVSGSGGVVGAREEYLISYVSQSDSEYCVSDREELLALSSFHPAHPYGFLVITGVCQHSTDLYDDDRWEMLWGFRY